MGGIASRGQDVLRKFNVRTIRDLGTRKFYKVAKAMVAVGALEQEGKREEGAALNINKAMDKAFETKSLAEMLAAPPSALQGFAGWARTSSCLRHTRAMTSPACEINANRRKVRASVGVCACACVRASVRVFPRAAHAISRRRERGS